MILKTIVLVRFYWEIKMEWQKKRNKWEDTFTRYYENRGIML